MCDIFLIFCSKHKLWVLNKGCLSDAVLTQVSGSRGLNEPQHEKLDFLQVQKQRGRSAEQKLRS